MAAKQALLTPAADILVVDDNVDNLRLLTRMLAQAGYRVRSAERPQLAIESALAYPPGLIMLDVMMPEMSGFEVCHRLKQDERTREIPIIFVSALQDVDDRVQGFEAGGVDFVSKPFEESEVLARVDTHLQLHAMQMHLADLVAERTAELTETNASLHREIAERKRAEEAVRESEKKLIKAQAMAHVGHWEWDIKDDIITWSDEVYRIYGIALQTPLTYDRLMGSIHPEDRDYHSRVTASWLENYGGDPYEYRVIRPDGSTRYIYGIGEVECDEADEPVRFRGTLQDITESKLAALALGESDSRFRATFEQAAVGIAHVAPDGRFLRLNRRFCDIVGYSHDELVARTFQDITHPDDLNTDLEHMRQLLAGETATYAMEKRYLRIDGEVVWINLTVSLVRKATGEPDYFVSVVEDISARKKLQEERDRILDLSQDLICIAGMDGYFKYLNPAWESTLGYTREELLARPFLDFIHPDDHARNNAEVEILAAGHHSMDFENRYIHKDGSICYVSWTATPLLKENLMYCIGHDMTERKQVEDALRESEERFRNLMEQSPISIQIHSPEGSLVQSNAAYARLYALNSETLAELYGKYNVLRDEQANRLGVMPYIEKAFMGEEAVFPSYEYDGIDTLKTLDFDKPISRKCWVQTQGFPLKDRDGRVTSVVFMSEDVTERKQAEAEILEYQQRLKALATELALAEERERRRIAAELHDHVGQSLALARIQLATSRKATSETRRNSLLDDASQTLRETIQATRNLVFELSSPLLNEVGLEAALSEWVNENIRKPTGLDTEVVDDGQEKPLSEDVQAILFRNVRELLTNVIKHANATSVCVRLKRTGEELKISVADDGDGMDTHAAAQKIKREGGFGLFSIQERMNDLGGSLQIVSAPGQGCTAILTAPLIYIPDPGRKSP